jgi:NTE family protein
LKLLEWLRGKPRIGLALGGGGARGLAHVPVLEEFEDLGLKPACVTGTSMGAIMGVLYCGGASASELRKRFSEMSLPSDRSLRSMVTRTGVLKWLDFAWPDVSRNGVIRADRFLDYVFGMIKARTFEELQIPLKVVASDFWAREPVVISSGDLLTAVRASMSVPGLFAPVEREGRLLVDGGMVNPVPWDILPRNCELTIAVDVIGRRTPDPGESPSPADLVFNTFEIAEETLNRTKREYLPPDVYLQPRLENVGMLEFYRAEEIFGQADALRPGLRRELLSGARHTLASLRRSR